MHNLPVSNELLINKNSYFSLTNITPSENPDYEFLVVKRELEIHPFLESEKVYKTVSIHLSANLDKLTTSDFEIANTIVANNDKIIELAGCNLEDLQAIKYSDQDLESFMDQLVNNPITLLIEVEIFLNDLLKQNQITELQLAQIKTKYPSCFLKQDKGQSSAVLKNIDLWIQILDKKVDQGGQLVILMPHTHMLYENGEFIDKILTGPFDFKEFSYNTDFKACVIKKS
jgi:hypothetical protein